MNETFGRLGFCFSEPVLRIALHTMMRSSGLCDFASANIEPTVPLEPDVVARQKFECSGAAAGDGEGQADVERPIV